MNEMDNLNESSIPLTNTEAASVFDPKILEEVVKAFEENYVPEPRYIWVSKEGYENSIANGWDLPPWEEFIARDDVELLEESVNYPNDYIHWLNK